MGILDLDPRWRALMAQGGVVDIGFDHPSDWPHKARGSADFVKQGADQLTAELCRAGDARYLRAALTLPIRGSDDALNIALWAEVPHAVFYAYLDLLEGGAVPAATLATLANDPSPIAAQDSPLELDFADGTARPVAVIDAQPDISLEQLIDLYTASGTLDRSAFTQS